MWCSQLYHSQRIQSYSIHRDKDLQDTDLDGKREHKDQFDRYGVFTNSYWTTEDNAATEQGHDAPSKIRFRSHRLRCPSDHYLVLARIRIK
ncbi:MAG: hypothetical protein II532_00135 [Bacteroidales bacterium]|nr:hypothetical protein [Bacteroidales bacterium]